MKSGADQGSHSELLDVGQEIRRRNQAREIPLNAFLPEEMNLSVAI